jgi:hypothetical protein
VATVLDELGRPRMTLYVLGAGGRAVPLQTLARLRTTGRRGSCSGRFSMLDATETRFIALVQEASLGGCQLSRPLSTTSCTSSARRRSQTSRCP